MNILLKHLAYKLHVWVMFMKQAFFFLPPDPSITSAYVLQVQLHADEETYRSMGKEPITNSFVVCIHFHASWRNYKLIWIIPQVKSMHSSYQIIGVILIGLLDGYWPRLLSPIFWIVVRNLHCLQFTLFRFLFGLTEK